MRDERTIKPNDPADFTPTLGNYKSLQPFRFWCQKVLPLVYDDSLSYYELLCKVVDYLNKTMEDVETLHGDVTNLHTAYEELQNYVNTYFSTLDVQEEINNKLDSLAKNGTLSQLIKPYVQESPTFVNSVTEMTNTNNIYVLKTNGHLYVYNSTTRNFEDSGLAYGINGIYPKNVDYNTWVNTIMNKQVFKDKQALFVTNPYNVNITNNSYECKSELVSHNCEFTKTKPVLIYGLTTPITNLDYFFRHYTVLVYSNVDNVKIRMYALTTDRQLANSYSSDDITLNAGMNLIKFTQTHGTVDTVESIGVLLLDTNNVKPVDIDKMYFTVIKDYYEKKEKKVNNGAFIGDSLTQQNYMAYFYYNQFTYKTYAVGGEDIPKIFARTNIDALYANNTGTINNGTVLDLNVKNMFKQGDGNINPVKVGESTFDIVLENGSYVVKNITKPFTYYGEYIISNTAQEKFDFYVIWCGTNSVTTMTKEEIVENWKKALTVYPNSIIIGLTCDRFTSVENLHDIDTLAKSKLGNRYLPMHDIIVKYGLKYNKLTPTQTDTADIAANKIPTQLLKDDGLNVHFNEYGQKYVAHIVQEFLKTYHIY